MRATTTPFQLAYKRLTGRLDTAAVTPEEERPLSSFYSSPFLPELAIPARDAARGRFRQRFEWLNALRDNYDDDNDEDDAAAEEDEGELVSFEGYEEAARQVRSSKLLTPNLGRKQERKHVLLSAGGE